MPNDLTSYLAGAPNLQAYADNHDGSVLDSVTGLIWEKAAPGTTYDLTSARAYCSSLTLAGHQDWRLPSFIELVSLVDYGAINFNSGTAAIDGTAFPSTPADSFISSTIWAASSAPVSVSFANGQLSFVSGPGYVRCVR